MGVVEKVLSLVMLPLGILIVLEEIGLYSLSLPFDKVLIGAILMIALQVINLIMLRIQNGTLTFINLVTGSIFIVIGGAYLASNFFGFFVFDGIRLILGVVMMVEALYALH